MIDRIDRRLAEWVKRVISDGNVSFAPPGKTDEMPLICLYLIDLGHLPTSLTSASRRAPLQFSLRYMVTAWAESPEESHKLLGTLVFAAMEHSDFDVEFDPLSPELWRAFGVAPRPSFMLRLPLELHRDEIPAPIIRSPVEIRDRAMASLEGQVVGPGSIPLAEALVELPSFRLATRTDNRGRFSFPSVPAEPRQKEFIIRAKGRELTLKCGHTGREEEPLIIHFDILEG